MSLMIYQAQELEGKKGQGSLEYLLMLGAAIVIVAVVVLAMMGTTNQGTEQNVSAVSGQSSDFSKLLKEVKNPSPIIFLEDAQSTPDSENTFVRVKNDGENAITITTLGTTTSSGTTSIYIPLTITSGNSASFAVPTSGTSCQCTAQETTKTCIFAIRYYSGTTIQTSNIERTITCNPSTGGGYTPPVDTVYPVVIPPTTLLLESAEGSSSSDDVFINLKTEGTDLATIANIRIDQTESTYTPTVTINPGNSINLSVISTGTSCQCTAQDTIKPCTFKINYDIAGTAKSTDFTKDITCNPITSSFNPATITSHDIPPTTLFLESAEGYSTSGKDMLVLKTEGPDTIIVSSIETGDIENNYTPLTITPETPVNFALLSTGTSCQCTAQETTKSCTFTINYTQGGEAKTMDIPTSITCNPTTSIYTPQTITNPNTFTNSATSTTTQLILTTAGLQGISSNLSASYMLFDNVDLTGVTFTPIGNITIPFTGTLDGAGNTISNLTINSPASSYLGLFGVVSGGTVKNITLANTSITGFQYLGGITGYLTGASTISNTKVSGSVTGNPNGTFFSSDGNTIGGLVGLSNTGATITNSSSSSTVTGYRNIGGLIGVNKGIVDYCSASGNVSGIIYTGGLIGSNIDTTVTNSFATGRVSGLDRGFSINNITYGGIGGLIGANTNSRISSSYATGDVNGLTSFIGGLIGRNDSSSPISNTYATGNVKASNLYPPSNISSAGGLIGVSRGSVVSNSYATGTVETYQAAGGLIGNQEDGSVVNSFATGVVKSLSGYCNGLVATVYYTAFVTGSYWYYVSPSCGGACYENRNTVKLNDGCTKKTDKSWFYYDSNGPMSTWDSAIWDLTICNGKNFPHLKMENKTTC